MLRRLVAVPGMTFAVLLAACVGTTSNLPGRGASVGGAPRGLDVPVVLDRRDYCYALAFDDDGAAVAWTHHVTTNMELSVAGVTPLAPRFQEPVNVNEFDLEDVAFVGGRVFVVSRQGALRAYDATTGAPRGEVSLGEPLVRLAPSPDRRTIAVAGAEGRVYLVDADTFAPRGSLRVGDAELHGIAWHDDRTLIVAGFDARVRVIDAQDAPPGDVHLPVGVLARSERLLLLAGLANEDGAQPRAIATTLHPDHPTTTVTRAAIARLGLRQIEGSVSLQTSAGPTDAPLVALGVLRLGTVVVGSRTAAVCDSCVPDGAELALGNDVLSLVAVREDVAAHELVVAPRAAPAHIMEGVRSLHVVRDAALPGPATDVDVHAHGDALVTFSTSPAVRSYEVYDAEQRGAWPPPSTTSGAVLWDPTTGAFGRAFTTQHKGFTVTGALSPDGRTVVTGGWDRRVIVFDAHTGDVVTERTLASLVRRIRFAPDGAMLGVAAFTPVNALNEGNSEPALLLYPLRFDVARAP